LDPQSKTTTAAFWTYDDILLRHFFDVSKSGDYQSLIKSGEANQGECIEAWEKIVQKNNYHGGNNQYDNYLHLIKQFNMAMKELNAVVSTILCLCFVVDDEQIKFLRKKGYKINTSGATAYDNSLGVALHESGKIRSKIKMKFNQLNNFNQKAIEQRESQGDVSVDDLISSLSFEVGFQLPDTITLAQYNAYAKRVKKRNDSLEKANKKGRGNVRA
jgi:hypothetical protein